MGESVLTRETLALPANIIDIEKNFLYLWIDLEVKLMYTQWLLKPTEEEYREGCELFINMVKKYAVECWIAESREMAGTSIPMQRAILLQLAPALIGSSLKKMARIIDKDSESVSMFESLSNYMKEHHRATIEVEQFITFEDAADWIGMIRG